MFAVQATIVFRMHGSAREVSAVLLVSLLPAIAIGPLAGVFADRWNPRRTMVASDGLRAVLVLLLATSMHVPSGIFSPVHFVRVCAICFAISCVSAFFVPAQAVLIPRLVDREELLAASAVMQQTLQVARIASPAAAGALVAHFGESACYAADAASFVFSAAILATISSESATKQCARKAANVARDIRAGASFLFANPELSFATLAMASGTFAAGCYSALAAIYVRDVLRAGTPMYSAIGSLTAAGTLTGTLVIGRVARDFSRETLIAAGMGVVGMGILMLAAFSSIAVTLIAAMGIGLGAAIALVAASALLNERTPAELRGRVSSVSMSMMSGAQAGAMLVAGSCAGFITGSAAPRVRGVYALSAAMLLAQPVCRYFRRETNRLAPSACFQSHP